MLNIAVKAARRAGGLILRHQPQADRLTVERKGLRDYVTEVDRMAEEEIIRVLRSAYPHHAILAEESGRQGDAPYCWVIDPLDGTTNFLHGYPQYAVSIALQHKGVTQQAVIFDPVHNDLYTAARGRGAQLNDRRIRVSRVHRLADALLATGFPLRAQAHLPAWLKMFADILPRTSGIRRGGSAALDLAFVASGRVEGFWEIGLKPWDMAAGCLLIEEAGGLVGDLLGGRRHLETGHIVCGNPEIYPQLLKLVGPHLTPALAG